MLRGPSGGRSGRSPVWAGRATAGPRGRAVTKRLACRLPSRPDMPAGGGQARGWSGSARAAACGWRPRGPNPRMPPLFARWPRGVTAGAARGNALTCERRSKSLAHGAKTLRKMGMSGRSTVGGQQGGRQPVSQERACSAAGVPTIDALVTLHTYTRRRRGTQVHTHGDVSPSAHGPWRFIGLCLRCRHINRIGSACECLCVRVCLPVLCACECLPVCTRLCVCTPFITPCCE